jgi:hypothetical protein
MYKDDGFIIVTVLGNGERLDLEAWADTYGLSSPVVSDTSNFVGHSSVVAKPTQQLIGRGGEILNSGQIYIGNDEIEAALGL